MDKKSVQTCYDLLETLKSQRNPKGVGLAAPQVDIKRQVFATLLPNTELSRRDVGRVFINPQIIDHSDRQIFGPDPEDPLLEGCLSIPGLYGPVPRYEWIELEFADFDDGKATELVLRREKFVQFAARVVQHEFDHLYGRLFTDYSLQYDLPVYQENPKTGKLEEIDKFLLEGW